MPVLGLTVLGGLLRMFGLSGVEALDYQSFVAPTHNFQTVAGEIETKNAVQQRGFDRPSPPQLSASFFAVR
jgi:hypothetical protein